MFAVITPALNLMMDGPFAPWLPAAILFILFITAAWDARTGIVPNIPLLAGAIAIIVGRFLGVGYTDAIIHCALGITIWIILWALNEGCYRFFKRDAIGMGDAKWTALAAATFGFVPAMIAWFAGAWIAIVWIVLSYLVRKPIRKVYFAPFLFFGLLIGLMLTKHIIELPYPYNFF